MSERLIRLIYATPEYTWATLDDLDSARSKLEAQLRRVELEALRWERRQKLTDGEYLEYAKLLQRATHLRADLAALSSTRDGCSRVLGAHRGGRRVLA